MSEQDLLTLHFRDWADIICLVILYVGGAWKWFELTSYGATKLGKWIIKKVEGRK